MPDPVHRLVLDELRSQDTAVNLTAAANYLSPQVQAAAHPALQNIHSEGYPGHRYHQGQLQADAIERLAVQRAEELFGADHANVQPYRGTSALLAAVLAVLKPGDTLMGLECSAGGHYSTGGSLHLIGRMFRVVPYPVCPASHCLDYDLIEKTALSTRPGAIVCGDTSYPRTWDFARLAEIADRAGAVLIADVSQTIGLIAAGVMDSPVPHAGITVAATYKTLRGPRAGLALCRAEYAEALDRAVYPLVQGGTNIATLAALAVALHEAGSADFADYGARVLRNAQVLVEGLRDRGFQLVTGGTDNHACLVDLRSAGLTGRRAAALLAGVGIVANANQIPYDPHPPGRPSGLRLGTPAVTTLGMAEPQIAELASLVADTLLAGTEPDERTAARIRDRVRELRADFPAPQRADLAQLASQVSG